MWTRPQSLFNLGPVVPQPGAVVADGGVLGPLAQTVMRKMINLMNKFFRCDFFNLREILGKETSEMK